VSMQPHQQRVIDEHAELKERREKLALFVGSSPIFDTLPGAEQDSLQEQLIVMGSYQRILEQRIARFS